MKDVRSSSVSPLDTRLAASSQAPCTRPARIAFKVRSCSLIASLAATLAPTEPHSWAAYSFISHSRNFSRM